MNIEQQESEEAMAKEQIGQVIVDNYGISRVIKLDDFGGYEAKQIIPKEAFIEAYNKWITPIKNEDKNESITAPYCINIPKNATNGNVIKMLFPSCETRNENAPSSFMNFTLDGVVSYEIEKSWWNTLYKTEREIRDEK